MVKSQQEPHHNNLMYYLIQVQDFYGLQIKNAKIVQYFKYKSKIQTVAQVLSNKVNK